MQRGLLFRFKFLISKWVVAFDSELNVLVDTCCMSRRDGKS